MKAEARFAAVPAMAGEAATGEGLHAVCRSIADHAGARWYCFGMRLATSFVDPDTVLLDGLPPGVLDRYRERNYIAVDPCVLHACQSVTPVCWDEVFSALPRDSPALKLFEDLQAFGIINGLSVPMHGSSGMASLLVLAYDDDGPGTHEMLRRRVADAHYLTTHLHAAAERVIGPEQLLPHGHTLTPREQECLLWCAEGKTSWETARILGISERTVIFHLQNVNVKLGVTSRQQAVARATARGIILPQVHTLPESI